MSDTAKVTVELRLLLIGRTGHGKSSVGNTILGRDVFKVSHGSTSCTDKCQYEERNEGGVRIVVTDTPGIFDTNRPHLTIMKELLKTVLYTHPGFHLIAFVIRPDRFTEELRKTKELFFEWFGENVKDYFCVIFTHSSGDEDIERYKDNPHPELAGLLQDCKGTVFPFENSASSSLKERQVWNLINHVHELKQRNNGRHFYNLKYHIANEYRKNRDLDTISVDSIRMLKKAGVDVTEELNNLKDLLSGEQKRNPGGGNLNIIVEDSHQSRESAVTRQSSEGDINTESENPDYDYSASASETYTSPVTSMHSDRYSTKVGSENADAHGDLGQTKIRGSRKGRVFTHEPEPPENEPPPRRRSSRSNRMLVPTPEDEVDRGNKDTLRAGTHTRPSNSRTMAVQPLPNYDPESNRQFRRDIQSGSESLVMRIIELLKNFLRRIFLF